MCFFFFVFISKLNFTLMTPDILVHLKQLSLTGLFHTGLTCKETQTSHRVCIDVCVDLSSEVTLPHKMAAQRNVQKKRQLAAKGFFCFRYFFFLLDYWYTG